MTQLTIVANIKANSDKVALVKAELLKLIAITRREAECINYDLHQDNKNPAHFMFYENWQTRELWQTHMANQHLADYCIGIPTKPELIRVSRDIFIIFID